MRYPAFLKENGTIGFVAPSFGCATEPYKSGFLKAQKRWGEQGFGLQLGPNCYVEAGVGISNTPEKCGEELTAYYCDKNNDCLISCGGGGESPVVFGIFGQHEFHVSADDAV